MGLAIALLIGCFYYVEVLFLGRWLRKLLSNLNVYVYLLLYCISTAILLPINLVVLTFLLNIAGADTEFVGFGFVLMGAIIFCLLIMVVMFIRETLCIRRKY